MAIDLGSMFVKLGADPKALIVGLSSASGAVGNFAKKFMNMKTLAIGAFAAVGIGAAILSVKGVKSFATFQEEMTNSMVMFDNVSADMRENAETTAKTLAVDLGIAPKEVAKAFWFFGSAGVDLGDTLTGLGDVLEFAKVNLLETADASSFAMTMMKVFAVGPENLRDTLNEATFAMKNANVNMAQMGDTFTYVAPVAADLGMNLAETAVITGVLADAGIKGSMAGTTLRRAILNLAAPSEEVSGLLGTLGVSIWESTDATDAAQASLGPLTNKIKQYEDYVKEGMLTQKEAAPMLERLNEQYDAEQEALIGTYGPMKDFSDILGELSVGMEGMSDAEKISTMETIFGMRSITGMGAAMTRGADEIAKMTDETENAGDVIGVMMTEKASDLAFQMDQLNSGFEVFKIAIGDALAPAVEMLVAGLTSVTNWFISLSPETQNIIALMVPLAAGIVGVTIVVWALVTAFTALAANPIILIITGVVIAIVALSVGIYKLWKHWDDVWKWISEHKGIAAVIGLLFPILIPIFAIIGAIKFLKANWAIIWTGMQLVFAVVWNKIIENAESAINALIMMMNRWINTLPKKVREVFGIDLIPEVTFEEFKKDTSALESELDKLMEAKRKAQEEMDVAAAKETAAAMEAEAGEGAKTPQQVTVHNTIELDGEQVAKSVSTTVGEELATK